MKIAHVIPALTKGGAERMVVDLANAAAETGDEVFVIAAVAAPPDLIADRLSPNVDLVFVGGRSLRHSYLRLPYWLYRNRSWLFELDVVHCHLTFGSLFARALQQMRSLFGRRRPAIVETYHAVGMAIPARARAVHALLLSGRDAVAFMAEDPYWIGYAKRHSNMIFRTIPNGIAPPEPAPASASEAYRKNVARIPPNARAVIGTVSRLVPARRPDLLLESFAHVAHAMGPDVHMLIAGEGPESFMLNRMAQQRRIQAQVHMPGLVLRPAEAMGCMDLFVTVNVGSITGIAALEAANLGVPIIALQLQQDYRSAADDWIWSSAKPDEVARKAVELLNDSAALGALATTQHTIARDRFSVDAMKREYNEFYGATLDRRDRREGDVPCR